MKQISPNATLKEYQTYTREMVIERGFDKETAPEMFMLLLEECGEFAKAARKSAGLKTDEASMKFNLAHEAADVFIYLLSICNHYNIDLEQAFVAKEELNSKRQWK